MKKILLIAAAFVLISSCGEVVAPYVTEIESEMAQTNVPITFTRADIDAKVVLENAETRISATLNDSPVALQFDDWDQDGEWDEVFGLMDLQQGTNSLSLSLADSSSSVEVDPLTNLHLGQVIIQDSIYEEVNSGNRVAGTKTATTIARYQFEGPGWENDLIAFRTYFDERNGIDIFGKRTSDMVLHHVGINDNYHALADWGMDILKVGNSLGAGAIALSYQDSLYRVTDDTSSTIKYLIEGPLRSSFEFYFPSVEVGDTVVSMTHRITIIAGMNGYESEVSVFPNLPGLQLATGIVNLHSEESYPIKSSGKTGIYTHDQQAFDGEYLGMAVFATTEAAAGHFVTPEEGDGITQTFGLKLHFDSEGQATFRFIAGWEKQNSAYSERTSFEEMVKREMRK